MIKYAALASGGAANFQVVPVSGYTLTVTNDTSVYPNLIALVVTPLHIPINITWRGNDTAQLWDNGNPANLVWRAGVLAIHRTGALTIPGDLSGAGSLSVTGAQVTLAGNNAANTTVSSTITGNGSLTKSGAARLSLNSGANTYAGNTLVNQGTLEITGPGSVPTNLVLNGGGVAFNVAGSYVQPGAISGLSAASPTAGAIGAGVLALALFRRSLSGR